MSEIIDFYDGKIDLHDKTFAGVCMFSNKQLDHCHDFIQWLFPTVERSSHHPNAPTLTQEDIKTFRASPVLKKKLLYSLDTFLRFLGLEYMDNGRMSWITTGSNYPERKTCWQTPFNHNYLRITRVLACLKHCGLDQEAEAFLKCLDYLYWDDNGKSKIPFESYLYWLRVVRPTK